MKISHLTYLLITTIALTPAVFAANGYSVSNANTNIPIPVPVNGFNTNQPPKKPANNGYAVSKPAKNVANNGYGVSAPVKNTAPNNGYSVTPPNRNVAPNNGYGVTPPSRNVVSNNGYSVTPPSNNGSQRHSPNNRHSRRHQNNSGFSFSINVPEFSAGFISEDDGFVPPFAAPHWVTTSVGRPIPRNTVVGGGENGHSLFICRGDYRGGLHPGKLVADRCNISWGGKEIVLNRYQLLVSGIQLGWIPGNYGSIPPNAFPGGYEHGNPLFICQAEYANGMHPGKIVGQMCNIAYGGKEILIPYYNVLVG